MSPLLISLVLSPLLLGIINRTKASIAGRQGPPLLQPYFDVLKLFQKVPVYSKTTTWIFQASPLVDLAALLFVLFFIPMGQIPALIAFPGDFIVVISFLALARFFRVIAALDTGSSFEGMGASRELFFASLTEVALFLSFGALAWNTGKLSLSQIFLTLSPAFWISNASLLALVSVSFFLIFLAENARIPVDDPSTHLELTTIHEVMILDHSGPDLAFLQYSTALKHWVLGALFVGVASPAHFETPWKEFLLVCSELFLLAILVGVLESSMARLRLINIPRLLVGAGTLSFFAMLFGLR